MFEAIAAKDIIERLIGNAIETVDSRNEPFDARFQMLEHTGPAIQSQPAACLYRIDEISVTSAQIEHNCVRRNLFLEDRGNQGLPYDAASRVRRETVAMIG